MDFLNADLIMEYGSALLKHNFTQMSLAFTLAAWLHRGWVKKDIKGYFLSLTTSIDNVADKVGGEMTAMKKDIQNLHERIDKYLGGQK